MKQFFWSFVLLSVILSCATKTDNRKEEQPALFTPPSIPTLIVEPKQKMAYLAAHYWQKANWNDTVFIQEPSLEAYVRDFAMLLLQVDTATVSTAIVNLSDSLHRHPSLWTKIFLQSEQLFNDPNSPLRNEEIFIRFLQRYIASPSIDEIEKIRPKNLLSTALKNKVGTVAADFVYEQANGKKNRLKNLNTPYILIYFNNPDCHDCARVKGLMTESSVLNQLIEEKKITVLSLYPDEDVSQWRRAQYPSHWVNGYDPTHTIRTKELYDLRAIPNIYLLNEKKEVLFKDIPFEILERYLEKE